MRRRVIHSSSTSDDTRARVGGWAVGLVTALTAAHASGLFGPFVFDDLPSIVHNESIRRLWPPWAVLSPPVGDGFTVAGRPVLNLSLALNHAFAGTAQTVGYHVVNLALHAFCALVLFGLVRRTLLLPLWKGRFARVALPLSWTAALLWAVHPLTTAAVTYLVQRAEVLASLFVLLTLLAFVRGSEASRPGCWWVAAILSCLAGMASKESAAAAPLLVLLYDRTFVAGSFRAAFQARWRLHLALATSWLLLAALVLSTHGRGGSVGFASGASPWRYLLTQAHALTLYLKLAVWPHPLVFDHGTWLARHPAEVAGPAALVLLLLGASVFALWRRPAWGFFAAAFFALLAPSSSFVPVATQTMAEHRMYLPLAALLVPGSLGLFAWLGPRAIVAGAGLAVGLGILTAQRNLDYRSVAALWMDTAMKRPANARAQLNAGNALLAEGRLDEALPFYRRARLLEPEEADGAANLGQALLRAGQPQEALVEFEAALRLQPDSIAARNGLAEVLLDLGQTDAAVVAYAAVAQQAPADPRAHYNLANALVRAGRLEEAFSAYEASLRLDPSDSEAHNNLGNLLAATGRGGEARASFERAVALDPANARARFNLGNALAAAGRLEEARGQFAAAAQLEPGNADAHHNLGIMLLQLGRPREAVVSFEQALRLQPDFERARRALESARRQANGR